MAAAILLSYTKAGIVEWNNPPARGVGLSRSRS